MRGVNRVGVDFGAAVRHDPFQGERGHKAGWRLTEWPSEWPESWRTGWINVRLSGRTVGELAGGRQNVRLSGRRVGELADGWLKVRLSGRRAGWLNAEMGAECSEVRPESWLAECSDEWLARGWLNVRLSGWRAGWRAGRMNSLRSDRMRRLMRVVI